MRYSNAFPHFGASALTKDGEPWFVGKDVAEILGYTNPRKAIIDHVDDEDKGVTKCDTLGGAQDLTIINESGLYSLILSSKLPTARAFKRWVTSEVLLQSASTVSTRHRRYRRSGSARSTARHALSARHSRRPVWRRSLLQWP